MSTYNAKAKNPRTGEVEEAVFMDDYFGRHRYGVQFPDGSVYREEEIELSE